MVLGVGGSNPLTHPFPQVEPRSACGFRLLLQSRPALITQSGYPEESPIRIEAVIFDLDGTLTRPVLDFDQIRAAIGGIEGPILEAVEKMPEPQQRRAHAILADYEADAAQRSELNPGAAELLQRLRDQGRLLGLLTRNSLTSVDTILRKHGMSFDAMVTRNDELPVKPDPAPYLHLCTSLEVQADNSLMVGDYKFDLYTAQRAGAKAVLLTTNSHYESFAAQADYLIHNLSEVTDIIAAIETR